MVELTGDLSIDEEIETDKQLLEKFLKGSDEAFALIVDRHALMVKGVCNRILRCASDSDDAFQATFFILASRAKSTVWQDSIAGWLHEVARRVSIKLRSNLSRQRIAEQNAAREKNDVVSDSSCDVGIRELGEILDAELARLPQRFREVIILTQVEGLSRGEMATRLGISIAAVKDRLERGRELLQNRLIKRGLKLSSASLAAWLIPNSANAAGFQTLVSTTAQMAPTFAVGKIAGAQLTASATLAQGVLKLMGLQKASVMLALLISLVTGGAFAFGFLQDNPTRFETGLRGKLVRLSTDKTPSITIELDEYKTLLDLDIASDARAWIAYEAVSIDKLKIGQYLAVKLASDNRTINEIHAQGHVLEATIRELNDTVNLTVEADDDFPDSPPQTVELSSNTIVRIGGMPATLEDLKPGMSVPLEFGQSGIKVNAIETETDEKQIIEGKIITVDLINNQIVLATEDENDQVILRLLHVDAVALISSGEQTIEFEDLRPGCTLRIRLDETGNSIRAIKASFPEQDD